MMQPRTTLLLGDCREVMATMDAESVDAIVCDPPYSLGFMQRPWDSHGGPHAFQEWCEQWALEARRVLKPGGFLLAFGGTRTYHRLASGIEDAGFEIRDEIVNWVYGSGFPKSLDASKAIDAKLFADWLTAHPEEAARLDSLDGVEREQVEDELRRLAGLEREIVGTRPGVVKGTEGRYNWHTDADATGRTVAVDSLPSSPEAEQWNGWGTALKPAHEPIVVARKPLVGSVAENVLEHGTGALNVAATRVGDEGGIKTVERPKTITGSTSFPAHASKIERLDAGRWPANVTFQHLEECQGSGAKHTDVLCAPGCPVAELNEQSGESSSSSSLMPLPKSPALALGESHGNTDRSTVRGHNDQGGAARFFYISKPRRRERVGGTMRNLHPTVKPVELMRWLVRLVTPPGGVVLDPFLGSGTTGCACVAEGFSFVGVEKDEESFDTAFERIASWAFAQGVEGPERA